MKYSVVIPTYNNKLILKNTLEALNNQKGFGEKDYEVIVVDDGSTDNTSAYIQGINRNYRLKYLYLERTPASCRAKTRNTGWKKASGEIIAFIDSDIIVKENYLLELDRAFSLGNNIVVIGNRLLLEQEVSLADIINKDIFQKYRFDNKNYQRLEFRYLAYQIGSYNAAAIGGAWNHVYSCNLIIPKCWLEKINGFDENFIEWGMEDIEIGYTLYRNGLQFVINSKLEVLHQYHGERNDLIVPKDKESGYEKNIDYFMKKHPEAMKMPKKLAYRFLKGDLATDKMLFEKPYEKIEFEFKEKCNLKKLKEDLFALTSQGKSVPIVYDFVEDTDLDMWVQGLGLTQNVIRYYPMSKKIDLKEMINYIEVEKVRQKNQAI